MDVSPCTTCNTRYHACHDTCEDYKAWKSKLVARRLAMQEAKREKDANRVTWGKHRYRSKTHKK